MQHYFPSASTCSYPERDRQHDSTTRGRKLACTGGNRSWSEDEESYLLQTRMQKMPYKHIAAHLKKTELACRLHYHQLTHGTHRRRRTGSLSSNASSTSVGQSPSCSQYNPAGDQDDCEDAVSYKNESSIRYSSSPTSRQSVLSGSPSRVHHKVILPKPKETAPQGSSEPLNGLRINTTDGIIQRSAVDTNRLRAIYEARRAAFWQSIAAEYGNDVSPAQLEEIWRKGDDVLRPPTPDSSDDGSLTCHPFLKPSAFPSYGSASAVDRSKGFSPINQAASAVSAPERMQFVLSTPTCSSACSATPSLGSLSRSSTWSSSSSIPATAIAALLTEDKSPRSEYCSEGRYADVAMSDNSY